jgi:hypothetical protein
MLSPDIPTPFCAIALPTYWQSKASPFPRGRPLIKSSASPAENRTPDCQKILDAVKANAASAIRADANGSGIFPGVPPGTYYLMISARYNNQALVWDHPIQLKPGPNSLSLDQRNATPIN